MFGRMTCAGLSSSVLVSSVKLATSMSNIGDACDNAKRYISACELGLDHAKGSDTHKAARSRSRVLGQLASRLFAQRMIRASHLSSRGTPTQFVKRMNQSCVGERVCWPLQGWSVWRMT